MVVSSVEGSLQLPENTTEETAFHIIMICRRGEHGVSELALFTLRGWIENISVFGYRAPFGPRSWWSGAGLVAVWAVWLFDKKGRSSSLCHVQFCISSCWVCVPSVQPPDLYHCKLSSSKRLWPAHMCKSPSLWVSQTCLGYNSSGQAKPSLGIRCRRKSTNLGCLLYSPQGNCTCATILFFPMQVTAGQNEVCDEGLLLHCTWIS